MCLTYIGFLAKWLQQASSGPGHGWELPLGLPPGWQGPGLLAPPRAAFPGAFSRRWRWGL